MVVEYAGANVRRQPSELVWAKGKVGMIAPARADPQEAKNHVCLVPLSAARMAQGMTYKLAPVRQGRCGTARSVAVC